MALFAAQRPSDSFRGSAVREVRRRSRNRRFVLVCNIVRHRLKFALLPAHPADSTQERQPPYDFSSGKIHTGSIRNTRTNATCNAAARFVLEALPHDGFLQNMQRLERRRTCPRFDHESMFDSFCAKSADHEPAARFGSGIPTQSSSAIFSSCSWKKVGKRKNSPMAKSETIPAFRDAAFAQDHALPARSPALRKRAPIP